MLPATAECNRDYLIQTLLGQITSVLNSEMSSYQRLLSIYTIMIFETDESVLFMSPTNILCMFILYRYYIPVV